MKFRFPAPYRWIVIAIACQAWLACTAGSCGARCQELVTEPLNDDERAAMEVINERSVKGALSFLASDELGGRGTPSPGYRVACGYVASRFRAAGLDGMGPDGSFYVSNTIELIQVPAEGIGLFDASGSSIPHSGSIAATGETVEVTAAVKRIGNWNEWLQSPEGQASSWPAILMLPAADETPANRQLRQIRRHAEMAKERGTQVILQAVHAENELVARAREMARTPVWTPEGSSWPIPALLVEASSIPDGEIRVLVPPMTKSTETIHNVVGVLPGSDPELAKSALIFSAHLDHLGIRENESEDSIYNGADDNASGVTGVLTLADAYGALKDRPARTLIFIAFWGEESGLIGSRKLVENPVWPLDRTLAMINLEMIGRPEPGAHGKVWMTGWEHSDLGSTMAIGSKRAGVEIFEHPQYSARLYGASDNWPFAEAGVIAHSFSAGSLHSDYHQPGDSWEKLETRHMTLVIQGLFAGSLPIAKGKLTPAKAPSR